MTGSRLLGHTRPSAQQGRGDRGREQAQCRLGCRLSWNTNIYKKKMLISRHKCKEGRLIGKNSFLHTGVGPFCRQNFFKTTYPTYTGMA